MARHQWFFPSVSVMDVNDLKSLFVEVKKRMDTQIEHVRRELGGVRTGRASVNILDAVHVEAYGSPMPLNQVASLSIPEPTLIVAQPFDPSLMGAVEKAIAQLEPRTESDQRRQGHPHPDSSAHRGAPQGALEARPQVRRGRAQRRPPGPPRRERALKKLLKDHKISEDDERRGLDEVQKITDQHVGLIDDIQKKKDAELLGK